MLLRQDIPKRLSDETHTLARCAQSGKWGRSLAELDVTLDSCDGLQNMSEEMRYAKCIELIAKHAPLHIVPGERIVGAATLKMAAFHYVPVSLNGKPAFYSVSHLTLGFDNVLTIGYSGLRQQIEERLKRPDLDERGRDLLNAMTVCLDAASLWHQRYMDFLTSLCDKSSGNELELYKRIRENLRNVPENPPASFYEAVQSLWFMFCFQRLCGSWPGIGRIDQMLGPYLKKDMEKGVITVDEAREILAHFWIKGCEWTGANDFGGSGDAQHYQNIVLGGIDSTGAEVTNEVTYLVLDIVEELRISDFPIAVRVSSRTPEKLLRRIAEVQRLGGGIIGVYNEDLIINSLVDFGYSLEEARRFANDGCWEVQVPGKTCFAYIPIDVFGLLQKTLGVTTAETGDGSVSSQTEDSVTGDPAKEEREGSSSVAEPRDNSELRSTALSVATEGIPSYENFEELYAAFYKNLEDTIDNFHQQADNFAANGYPAALVSLFTQDCIEKGRGYYDRGPRYTVLSPHAGGLPDTGNSLLVIKRLVYEEKRIGLQEFVRCLRANWEGYEDLRQHVWNSFKFFGNDNPEADAMTRRVFNDFVSLVRRVKVRNGVLRPPGVSTFGREIEWCKERGASATGRFAGEYLATNFSPSPGTDRLGPTAVIKSHCSMGLEKLTNGTALELKVFPGSVDGESGLDALIALIKSFIQLGGIFMHVDVVDNKTLLDAQVHPERHQNLAVRVSGWSARFVTLDKEWQDMIINRTMQR